MSTEYYVSSTRRHLLLLYAVALAITCFIVLLTVSAAQANTVPRAAAPAPSGLSVQAQALQYASLAGEPRLQYVETLGNTLYTENATWTSDRTYVLAGSIIVGPGVTLTIQPGTIIKADPGQSIRIDGTLVAQGTAEQPILFTSSSGISATWGGLRFTYGEGTSYDLGGAYLRGSILQHVEIVQADTGVVDETRGILIADSNFRSNGTAIYVKRSSPRIERNSILGSSPGPAIMLDSSSAIIKQNRLNSGSSGIRGSGNPTVEGNEFQDNYGTAVDLAGSPSIRRNKFQNNAGTAVFISSNGSPTIWENIIVGNGAAIETSEISEVNVVHNLVVGNDRGIKLNAHMTYVSDTPAVAYNPTADEYMIAWSDRTGTYPAVNTGRISGDGRPLNVNLSVLTGNQVKIAYNTADNEYMVGGSTFRGLSLRRLDSSGAPLGPAIQVTNTWSILLKLIYQTNDSSYLLLCRDGSDGNNVYVQRINRDGSPGSDPVVIDRSPGYQTGGDAAYDPLNNRSLVVFNAGSGQDWLFGSFVSPAATASAVFTLATDVDSASLDNLQGAYNGEGYTIVWDSNGYLQHGDIRAARVAVDGTPTFTGTIDSDPTGYGRDPKIIYAERSGQVLVAWFDSHQEVYSNYWVIECNGLVVDNPWGGIDSVQIVSQCASYSLLHGPGNTLRHIGAPTLAYNSRRKELLVIWSDDLAGTYRSYDKRVGATGKVLDTGYALDWPASVLYNTIINNGEYGLRLSGLGTNNTFVRHNNLIGNGAYDLYLDSGTQDFQIAAGENYWGVPEAAITGRIRDCALDAGGCDNSSATTGHVNFSPSLSEPEPLAPAFARTTTMEPNPVGLQPGTLTLDFSQPMATGALPAALFHDSRHGSVQQLPTSGVGIVTRDAYGRMWFGLEVSLLMFDGRRWMTYTQESGLGAGDITALYGAENGDLWVGYGSGSTAISRLRGTTWTHYPRQLTPSLNLERVTTIGEDGRGILWVGTSGGALRFDGTTWLQYSTANGLANDYVNQLVHDDQGRMWILNESGPTRSKLSVFDGVTWTTHDTDYGLPADIHYGPLFADSQGRVWISIFDATNSASNSAAMFQDDHWTFFGTAETNGQLTGPITGFTEMSDGSVWIGDGNHIAIYKDGAWSRGPTISSSGWIAADSHDNLWHVTSDPTAAGALSVLWRGLDYAFENGLWLSPTRFQASYTFSVAVPPGSYVVELAGATGSDGMPSAPTGIGAFAVDFGPGITLDPPDSPAVSARTDGSLTTLYAFWQNSSRDISQYRYAVGTTPGGRDVVGWTYLTTTSLIRADLQLIPGQAYYVTVQASSNAGLWSLSGISNRVVAGVPSDNLFLPQVNR